MDKENIINLEYGFFLKSTPEIKDNEVSLKQLDDILKRKIASLPLEGTINLDLRCLDYPINKSYLYKVEIDTKNNIIVTIFDERECEINNKICKERDTLFYLRYHIFDKAATSTFIKEINVVTNSKKRFVIENLKIEKELYIGNSISLKKLLGIGLEMFRLTQMFKNNQVYQGEYGYLHGSSICINNGYGFNYEILPNGASKISISAMVKEKRWQYWNSNGLTPEDIEKYFNSNGNKDEILKRLPVNMEYIHPVYRSLIYKEKRSSETKCDSKKSTLNRKFLV